MVFKPQKFHETSPQAEIDDPTEAGLEARAAEALARASSLDASQVEVTVTGSVATLIGTVGLMSEKDTAAEVVAHVPGISAVDNKILAAATSP